MITKYTPLITVPSPAPNVIAGEITLFAHTWYDHVRSEHHDVLLGHVRQAMNDPCEIVASKTVTGSYLLLNHQAQSTAGTTLRVPVRPLPTGTNIVTTAYYSGANSHGIVVWRRGDG